MIDIQYISAEEAVRIVKSGAHIHLSSAAQIPFCLIQALTDRAKAEGLTDIHFHHSFAEGEALYAAEEFYFDQSFFISSENRKFVNVGVADHIPINLSETQVLYRRGATPCDIAFIEVSLPDKNGNVSLGGDVVCSIAAIEVSKFTIAVVNSNIPFTFGDSVISIDKIDFFVRDDHSLIHPNQLEPNEIEISIGKHCAELIPDGACLQMGIGALPNALASQLNGHRNLGLHSEMFTDGVLQLIMSGVINGLKKKIDIGKSVSSFILGSKEVFDYVNLNNNVLFKDIRYTNNPYIIAQNPNVAAVNAAIQIDLTGQVCSDSVGQRIISGSGGQLDFVRGASLSEGGISIIALPTKAKNGDSKIVPVLNQGAGVVTPRADVNWVVTEYGAVNLFGKSLQERAKLLISISNPDDRNSLDEAAFKRFGPHYHNFSV